MLTQVEAISARGELDPLTMSISAAGADQVQIRGIEGLGPVKADLPSAGFFGDGDYITGKRVGKRNIVLTLGLNPDWVTNTISDLRTILYAYFMPKRWIRLELTSTHIIPKVFIEGYVESVEPNMFSQDPEMQVSIICPRPDFVSTGSVTRNGTMHAAFGTPLIFDYEGTVPTGFILEQTTPSTTFTGELYVKNDCEESGLFGVTTLIQPTRQFLLSTEDGSKFIREVNGGVLLKNLLGSVNGPMDWIKLHPGENQFELKGEPSSGGLLTQQWELTYSPRYGGL